MRFTTSGAVAALLLGSMVPAGAQTPPPPPVMVSTMNWTGLYAGVNFGGDWTTFPGSWTIGPNAGGVASSTLNLDNHSNSSLTGGGQIGYNWQGPSNWVLGVELNFDGTGTSRQTQVPLNANISVPPSFIQGDAFKASSDWNGSARVKLGYAWGSVLPYITGGVAFADNEVTSRLAPGVVGAGGGVFLPAPGVTSSTSSTLIGWTVGGGIEYALSPAWSLGAQYRHAEFGNDHYNLGSVVNGVVAGKTVTSAVSASVGQSTDTVLVTLNYHFGAPPPPAPPLPPPPPPPAAAKVFIVFFDWDKDTITREGQAIIQQAADAYKAGASVQMQIQVIGYTDRSGSAGYNQRLSERRANNVAKAMAALGVPQSSMVVAGRGENDNRVPTADGVREPQNRRVEITE